MDRKFSVNDYDALGGEDMLFQRIAGEALNALPARSRERRAILAVAAMMGRANATCALDVAPEEDGNSDDDSDVAVEGVHNTSSGDSPADSSQDDSDFEDSGDSGEDSDDELLLASAYGRAQAYPSKRIADRQVPNCHPRFWRSPQPEKCGDAVFAYLMRYLFCMPAACKAKNGLLTIKIEVARTRADRAMWYAYSLLRRKFEFSYKDAIQGEAAMAASKGQKAHTNDSRIDLPALFSIHAAALIRPRAHL